MYQRDIWQDITYSVHQAMLAQLHRLREAELIQHGNALLATLPSAGGSSPATITVLLRHYHAPLHRELCRDGSPRATLAAGEDELRELTRAVLLTVGIGEGLSVEAAVGIALVLSKRGIPSFCALPARHTVTA